MGISFVVLEWHGRRVFLPRKRGTAIELLPKALREQLPPLYSQEAVADPLVICKFFTPDAQWTWYALEFDGDDVFFGWVVGLEQELGYFLLAELTRARGPLGLPIERDVHFSPTRLSQVKLFHQRGS